MSHWLINSLLIATFAIGSVTFITGCEDKNAAEEAAEEVGDEMDDAT